MATLPPRPESHVGSFSRSYGLLGTSLGSSPVYAAGVSLTGASPTSSARGSDKSLPTHVAASKWWSRIHFDATLDPHDFTIGWLESVQQQERKSGAKAWSLRVHDKQMELPYADFVARFPEDDVPFHRITHFKHHGMMVWESDYHRKRLLAAEGVLTPAAAAAAGGASSSAAGAYGVHGGFAAAEGSPLVAPVAHRRSGSLGGAAPSPAAAAGLPPPAHGYAHGHGLHAHGHPHGSSPVAASPYLSSSLAAAAASGGATPPPGLLSRSLRRRSSREGSFLAGSPYAAGAPRGRSGSRGRATADSVGSLPSDDEGCGGFRIRGRSSSGGGGASGGGAARSHRGRAVRGVSGGSGDEDEADNDTLQRLLVGDSDDPDDRGASDGDDDDDLVGDFDEECDLDDGDDDGDGGCYSPQQQRPGRDGEEAEEEDHRERQLPEECWVDILHRAAVREVCMLGRVNRWLRQLAAYPAVWRSAYCTLFGEAPPAEWNDATVRRQCRRSELKAARWLEADPQATACGFLGTSCLQMDDSKAVSGDGSAVRLWSHATGRRIATLQGHSGRVSCVAFDDELLVSGCTASTVRLWGLDDLKCRRVLRGHEGAVSDVALMGGIPISAGEDGLIRLWDVASSSPIVTLEAHRPVMALEVQQAAGYLVSAGGAGVQMWDVSTAQLLHTLGGGAGAGAGGAGAAADGGGAEGDAGDADGADGAHHGGAGADPLADHPFTCVSFSGNLLAAGRTGECVLWDVRTQQHPCIGTLVARVCAPHHQQQHPFIGANLHNHHLNGNGHQSGAPARGGPGSGSSGGGGGAPGAPAPCAGVQLDDWKLVVAFNDGLNTIAVHDLRAAGKGPVTGAAGAAGANQRWLAPAQVIQAPARVHCFQFHRQQLLAGLEGQECTLWRFEPPAPLPPLAAAAGAAASAAGAMYCTVTGGAVRCTWDSAAGEGVGGYSPGHGGAAVGAGSAKKDKKKKVAKKQTRYPKRSTK